MITIKQDAELMTNLLPANPVPAGNRFVAFRDEDSSPAVFSLGQDHKLNLVISIEGVSSLVDFGKLCGITTDVQAFDMRQGADLKIWIAIEAKAPNNMSNFYLVFDLQPNYLLAPPESKIIRGTVPYPEVHGMFMSNFTRVVGGKSFPMIFLAFQPLDRITKEDQLGYVDIILDGNGKPAISLNRSWKLATNPLKIIDVTFVTCPLGQGAYVLYQSTGGLKLQFRTFGSRDFAVEIATPPGTQCVTSYEDPSTKHSVLLVGGDIITQYKYRQYVASAGTGTPITTGDKSLGLKDIHATQSGDALTIWYTTAKNGAHYYSAPISAIDQGILTQLIPDGAGGRISGLLSTSKDNQNVLVNTLVSVTEKGFLTVLQQASDTGMWEVQPFYTPSSTNNMEVQSFTLRIRAMSDDTSTNHSVARCQLHLTSSGFIEVLANGATTTLDQDGGWYETDDTGVLTIIISTEDMSCHTVQVDKFKPQTGVETPITVALLNPTQKLNTKLMVIKTGEDLANAKTQTGQNLITPGSVDAKDLDAAANMITELNKSQIRMDKGILATPITGRRCQFSDSLRKMKPILLAGRLPSDPEHLAKLRALKDWSWSSPWDSFMYLLEKAKDATTWLVEQVGDFIHFVVELAGEVYRFVLDSIVAVGKAMSWVFAKIGVGIEKLIEFIGFLFSWDDILQTTDSIVTYLNAGLAYSGDQLLRLDDAAKAWVQNLRTQMQRKVEPDNIATSTTTSDPNAVSQTEEVQGGVGYNWSSYQMQHGGFTTNGTITAPSNSTSPSDITLKDLWDDIVKEVAVVETLANGIVTDIGDLFTSNTSTSQIFARLSDQLINAALGTLENVVDFMLKAVVIVLRKIGEMGNYKIEVPVFSFLWKQISGGRDFTVFNCLALIVAIPTTVLYKIVASTAPPRLAGRLTKDTFASYVTGNSSLDPTLAKDIASVGSMTAIGVGIISLELTMITMAIDAVGGGLVRGAPPGGLRLGGKSLRSTSVAMGNTIDAGSIILGSIALALAWPLKYKQNQDLHWGSWGLDVSNLVFLSTSRFVGWKFGLSRPSTKRFVGIWEFLTSIPTYILDVIIEVDNLHLPANDPEKDDAEATREIIQDTMQLISAWSFCAAALSDDQPELEDVLLIALAAYGLSLATKYSIKFAGVYIEYFKDPGPKLVLGKEHVYSVLNTDYKEIEVVKGNDQD